MHDNDMETTAKYQKAWRLEKASLTNSIVLNTTLYPYWIEGSDCFWYVRETKAGVEYRLVDAEQGTNNIAFDHLALSTALEVSSGRAVDSNNLPIDQVTITLSPRQLTFTVFGIHWLFDDTTKACHKIERHPEEWAVSPDGKKAVYTRDYNLWVCDLATKEDHPLTVDGERFYVYASTPTIYGRQELETLEVLWSADSRRLFTVVTDTRQVKTLPTLVQHVPEDGSLRPVLVNKDRRVAFPDDECIEVNRFLAIDIDTGQVQFADYAPCPVFYPPYKGVFSSKQGWWSNDNQEAYFIELKRGGLTARLIAFDTHTGITRVVIEEASDTRFTFIPSSHLCTLIEPLLETNEVIWYSERSGWAHLYLYDTNTGRLKNPITRGDWLVRNVLHIDVKRRELVIQTAGRNTNINPYYCDICRVHIDTGELTPLLCTDHNYLVCDARSRATYGRYFPRGNGAVKRLGVSPSGRYIISTRSRVDQVPVSLLFDSNGNELLLLEKGDISALPEHWQWPEPIMLKAADDETDIYGVVFRPSDFSPHKSYGIIDYSYCDHTPIGSFSNNDMGSWLYFSAAACAELGFIVVMIKSRGTSLRSKEFATDKDSSLFYSYHQSDCIAGIQQLAQRYSYMDLDRVGVSNCGGSSASVSGLLRYPDFYKVGVSLLPNLDARIFAQCVDDLSSDGLPPDDNNRAEIYTLAANLKGKLFLIHGMLDDVCPVASTLRLVEVLQQANKDFDMLLLPCLGHGSSDYITRRTWDYLVRHLQQV